MKRFFFSLIALSAAAIGCTQSALLEAPDLFSTEVSFSPYTGRAPETKATSIEGKAGLAANGFYVYGFLNQTDKEPKVYLENELVSSADEGKGELWEYTNIIYWPTSEGSSLDFVAYSANGVGKGLSGVSENGFTFTVSETVSDQVDLLATAYQAGNTLARGSSVNLKFHHLLSRVGFKVQSTTSKEVTITALKFTGDMPTQGTLDFDAAINRSATDKAIPELQPTVIGTPTYVCLKDTDAAPATSGRVPGTEYLMIMPHIVGAEYDNINTDELKGSDHHIDVTYVIEGSEDKPRTSRVTLPIGFEFEAGKAYEIVLKISTSSLTFDVQEEDWNTGGNANINPNDPPAPEEEEEEEEPVENPETQVSYEGLTVTLGDLTYDVATFYLNVNSANYTDEGELETYTSSVYINDKRVGISYRKKDSATWTIKILDDSQDAVNGSEYAVRTPLEPSTEYECCSYSVVYGSYDAKKNWLGQYTGEVTYSNATEKRSEILTFTTLSSVTYPSFTTNDIRDNDITTESDNQFSVNIRSKYDLGHIDGAKIKIKEYGLCWIMGTGKATIMDDKMTWKVATNANEISYDIQHTIPNLKPNTTYSFCAYAIMEEDRVAYIRNESGHIIPSLTKIFTADQIIYSSVQTFTTKSIIDDNDNNGGNWGDGYNANLNDIKK